MTSNLARCTRLAAVVFLLLNTLAAVAVAAPPPPAEGDVAASDEREKIVHALNRLGFGPRPGDVDRVEEIGLTAYIERQLDPAAINDAALEARLAETFPTLRMPPHELTKAYLREVKRFIEMQRAAGNGEDLKLRTGVDVTEGDKGTGAAPAPAAAAKPGFGEIMKEVGANVSVRAVAELQTAKLTRAVESERQLQEVLVDFWFNHFNVDVRKDACRVHVVAYDRETIRPHVLGKFRRLLGAVAASPAMLTYLDNVENSRPHELSPLEQRVRAAAVKGMFGVDEGSGMAAATKPRTEGGLNENYARELLELAALGVDGGYTQRDVEEVARCFTGWGVNPLLGTFAFEARRHDDGAKRVLGQAIAPGGGVRDGMRVLDLLARHPSTARFVAAKLCRRFVADDPPAALVDRAAATFRATDGDLRAVVRTIVTSDEFHAPAARRAKLKSPLEFAASAVRVTGGTLRPRPQGFVTPQIRHVLEGSATIGFGAERLSASRLKTLNWHVFEMGQPLFACQPPTGYSENSRKWVSSGALIARLNFAIALTGGSVIDVAAPAAPAAGPTTDEAMLEHLSQRMLHVPLADATRAALLKKAADAPAGEKHARLLGLALGSPEFQRR